MMDEAPKMSGKPPSIRPDPSLSPEAAFGTAAWAAARLGVSLETFRQHRYSLHRIGLPFPDPLLNRYHKADVEAWLAHRRRIAGDDADEIDWTAL